jgi:hypothetical protein
VNLDPVCLVKAKAKRARVPVVIVKCNTATRAGCQAQVRTAAASRTLGSGTEVPGDGEVISEPTTVRPKKRRKRFRTNLRLRLNARGRELLRQGDLNAVVVVTIPERNSASEQLAILLKALRRRR